VSQLRHSYPAFRELNAEVLAIAAVGLKPLTAFARELELPFPVLSDVTGEAYFAFGLGKGMVIRSRTLLAIARLVWRAKRLYRPIGDIMQVGGDFIVDGMGIAPACADLSALIQLSATLRAGNRTITVTNTPRSPKSR